MNPTIFYLAARSLVINDWWMNEVIDIGHFCLFYGGNAKIHKQLFLAYFEPRLSREVFHRRQLNERTKLARSLALLLAAEIAREHL